MATYNQLSINDRINYKVYAALDNATFIASSMYNRKKAVPIVYHSFFPNKYGYNIIHFERKEYLSCSDLHILKFVQNI